MLKVEVVLSEGFDDETQTFVSIESKELHLEHSLVSLSKWESKWKIPFLSDKEKTPEQMLDYIRCMTLNEVDPEIYHQLSQKNIQEISEYINDEQTATIINDSNSKKTINKEVVTAELFYYWMVAHTIPFDCQYWHLNKLMTLIRVCNIKNQPEEKMTRKEIMEQREKNKQLNEARRKTYNTSG